MEKVFVNLGLSLDGYLAPEGMTLDNWDNPGYKNWAAKWGAMMGWVFNQQYFRDNLKLGPGGETGPVNEMLKQTTERIGANIMGKRMFEGGERVNAGNLTKRALDAGDSAPISSSFLRLSLFLIGRRSTVRPSASNANRWAARHDCINRFGFAILIAA